MHACACNAEAQHAAHSQLQVRNAIAAQLPQKPQTMLQGVLGVNRRLYVKK